MNSNNHFFIALILLIGIYFILNYFDLNIYLGYASVLVIGAILPDIIEPAKDYTHRNYFHSKRFLKIIICLLPISLIMGFFINYFFYLFFLIIGYLSHLLLDSTTKMGLPK